MKKNTYVFLQYASIFLISFTLLINSSEAFAHSLNKVSSLENIASLLTFRNYSFKTDNLYGDVNTPKIITGNDELNDFVNVTINNQVSKILEESRIRALEYKKAFLETGGTIEAYNSKDMKVSVNYNITTQNDKYLSFNVYSFETIASAYASYLYFSIDLENKKLVSLDDLLGSDYLHIISTTVSNQIENDRLNNPNKYFDNNIDSFISKDIDFYIKSNNILTVIFNKYTLAKGAYGRLEFDIPFK